MLFSNSQFWLKGSTHGQLPRWKNLRATPPFSRCPPLSDLLQAPFSPPNDHGLGSDLHALCLRDHHSCLSLPTPALSLRCCHHHSLSKSEQITALLEALWQFPSVHNNSPHSLAWHTSPWSPNCTSMSISRHFPPFIVLFSSTWLEPYSKCLTSSRVLFFL